MGRLKKVQEPAVLFLKRVLKGIFGPNKLSGQIRKNMKQLIFFHTN